MVEGFHLLEHAAAVASPAVEISVASLHEASAAAAFGAGNLDVESALRDLFDGVGGDGLQVLQGYGLLVVGGFFGKSGVSVIAGVSGVDEAVCGIVIIGSFLSDSVVLLFVLEIELSFFIRNFFLDFGEVGSVISWLLIVKIFLFHRFMLNLCLMIVVFLARITRITRIFSVIIVALLTLAS